MRTSTRNAIDCTKLGLAILAGLAIILLGAAFARAAEVTKIESCPYAISSPGRYLISADLECAGDGIIITANEVHLNGGHHLIGDGTGTGILVQGTQADVVINNARIQGFNTGIRVEDASGVLIMNSFARGSSNNGIELIDSDDIIVGATVASGNGGDGIALFNTSGSIIQAGGYFGNEDGIDLDENSGDNAIIANLASGNMNDGIEVDGHGNFLQANHVEESGDTGIQVGFGSTENIFLANTARDNSTSDVADFNLPACVNTWKSNNFETDNEGDGSKSGCIQ